MPAARRHFGSVRKLSSGRFQARYRPTPEAPMRPAPQTFCTKADANAWLSRTEADLLKGEWIDPNAGRVTLRDYANLWLYRRPDLRPSTKAKYRDLLDRHILPDLGDARMSALQPSAVRGWWAALHEEKPSTAAGAYRLLSTICRTAVADQVIVRTPCTVKGGGVEKAAERPTAKVAELARAVEEVPEKYRAAVLLAAWCQLRRSEILGLQRRDVDELHGTLKVQRGLVVHTDGKKALGMPKTEAGVRTVAIPANVTEVLSKHLQEHVEPEADAWLFPGRDGQPITPRTLDRIWERARAVIGRPELRLHDLRHTGLTLAAATGATTAELMLRAGHASPAAALRYQHATQDRDRVLADALADMAQGKAKVFKGREQTA